MNEVLNKKFYQAFESEYLKFIKTHCNIKTMWLNKL